jgi:MYXO-CTERM domain-containing protein
MYKIKYLTMLFILATLLVAAGGALASPSAAVAPVLTLQTKGFAVLGGSSVNGNGAPSNVIGDLGVSPGSSVIGFPPGTVTVGTTYTGTDATAMQARSEVTAAYNTLGQTCDTTYSGSKDLVGLNLAPGVYCAGDFGLSGILTLTGNATDVWIFRSATTLITGTDAKVILSGGGKRCNVWWQVGTSATLGTRTVFAGNILADVSISLDPSASMFGAALAGTGAVTMADANTIEACFDRATAIAIQEIQATSADGSPSWLGAGAALLLALGLIVVIRQRVRPSGRQQVHGE